MSTENWRHCGEILRTMSIGKGINCRLVKKMEDELCLKSLETKNQK